MSYIFTSESVSEGHPDKLADQISDAIIDNYIAFDKNSKVACETLVTTNLVVLAGEIKSKSSINEEDIVRKVIKKVGYDKSEYLFDFLSCEYLVRFLLPLLQWNNNFFETLHMSLKRPHFEF